MTRFKLYKRDWLISQNHLKLYNISKDRNIDVGKFFTNVNEKFLVNRETKNELIDEIIKTNIEYKDIIQTIIRVIAVFVALMAFIWGIFGYLNNIKKANQNLVEKPTYPQQTDSIPKQTDSIPIIKPVNLNSLDTSKLGKNKLKSTNHVDHLAK